MYAGPTGVPAIDQEAQFPGKPYWTTWDGVEWAPQKGVPGAGTSESPALASLPKRGIVVMAWKGTGADNRIWFTTFDGTTWAPQALVPNVLSDFDYNFTSVGPALTAVSDVAYMTWKGNGSDQSVYYCYFDGYAWSPAQTVNGIGTSFRPALSPSLAAT